MIPGNDPVRACGRAMLPECCSRQTGYDPCILPRSHRILQFAE